ncbi:MAG: Gfo/Idh/MocA family oxidoreductase [Gemmatimonadota bacterium]|nr:Gfo/Idh/MocA family oxidoreductase [Gemmatimonadota bacterium]
MSRKPIARREFIEKSAGAGLAFTIVPRHVLGRGYRAPSDTLNIACIGVGGRGRSDVNGVSSENIYALCDVDWAQAANTFHDYPDAKRYRDFRVMLDEEADNIDAVTVATPDHTHAVAAIAAMERGKHVYCEKPLARTIGEVKAMVDAARRSGVRTQMGNQGHAGEGTRQIREAVEAGAIGTVREIQYWTNRPIWPQAINRPLEMMHAPQTFDWDLWLGPAAERPYHPAYAPFRWRGWWDFGTGALGDIACHAMDAAYWALELGYPERIVAESTRLYAETAPAASRIEYHFPATRNRGPIHVVWRDGNFSPPRPEEIGPQEKWPPEESGQMWIGDDGKLVAGIYGENPTILDKDRHAEITANPPEEQYPRVENVHVEWLNACKGGTPAGSNFEQHSGPLTEMVLLGNLAVRTAMPLDLDSNTGAVLTPGVPAEYLETNNRTGW